MPVWYPDIAIGPFVNFQRIRTNVFFDYAFGQSISFNQSQQYSSVGVEAKVDLNIMRFLPQFNMGVRFSHGLTPAVNKFEILIGTINL
jgi:cell fate regulator YaaT (PSP1 superfamily)